MVFYNLDHLTQSDDQQVVGPIQDDEALFLYALIKGMRARNILEIGGQSGYSARNFLAALPSDGKVYTVDIDPVPQQGTNHIILLKDCAKLSRADFSDDIIDIVFFDAHDFDAQLTAYQILNSGGVINDDTVIALHDTNLHREQFVPWAYRTEGGFVHQAVERRMVTHLKGMGYDSFSLHPNPKRQDDTLLYRHGLTVMQKYKYLDVSPKID